VAVRSAELGSGVAAAGTGEHIAYTCPAGKTAIVKEVRVSPTSGSSVSRCLVFIGSGTLHVSLIDRQLAALTAVREECWSVLEPGDQVRVYAEGADFSYWVSGAELDGVA